MFLKGIYKIVAFAVKTRAEILKQLLHTTEIETFRIIIGVTFGDRVESAQIKRRQVQ